MLTRSTAEAGAAGEERFRALLREHGGGTMAFMGTWPGNTPWYSPDGEAAVAYRVINDIAITMSDPICAPERAEQTVREFAEFCDRNNWQPVFYSVHPQYLPIFEGLSPASLEQAAGHLSRVRTTPGEVIVRQGDPADRFFHILDGSFEVTQVKDPGGAPRFLRTLGPDEVFGEIGILSGVPRTATVTANGDGALLALDGQRFLDLVGSGPGLSSRLLDVHRGTGARLEVARDDA